MARLRLIPLDVAMTRRLEDGAASFEAQYAARLGQVADLVRDVARQTGELLFRLPRAEPWGAYLAVEEATSGVVGTCAFKSAPIDGIVEIAYFTFPPFERQGVATAMAGELLAISWASPAIHKVIAHTLPEENASARLLRGHGFRFTGEAIDPEDGLVWRWELDRPPS